MITFMIIVIVFIGVMSLIGTLYAGKQVNETIRTIDKANPEHQADFLKTNYYKNSKSNFVIMTTIYILLFIIFIIGFAIYWFFFK